MKYYYLGFNRVYLNPWTEQVLACFNAVSELIKCGPGFNLSIEILKENITNQDILIVDSLVLEHQKFKKMKRPFGSSYYGGDISEFPAQLENMIEVFDSFKGKKIFIGNLDVYGASNELVKYIQENNIHVVSFSDKNTTLDYTKVNLSNSVIPYANPTSCWHYLVTSRPDLVISFPHFIDENEFIIASLKEKRYFCDIPGVMYEDRRAAERLLTAPDKIRLMGYKAKRILDFLPNKLNGKLTFQKVKMLNLTFRMRIFNTKVVYTCGSLFDFPVRKFFEIPSQSSLLVCKPFFGMEHLGFKKGLTHLETKDLESLKKGEIDESIQEIATSGAKLVFEKHSSSARQKQLRECLDRIEKDEFLGSCWKSGSYEV
ncbi:hypothetical protein [Pseudoalteromonas piscicida]|uniref:Glycosyltransferase family 1 protein n=1 Tax=Pseudoalteromonas piscicida TaxID=43662 RepID=A0A2A5JW92_PSEO7|nr:hypothetical protein [Pseudoalteromonas piscicida]PCK33609.1 hypothetical protein CEX98_00905 [Pseudoalteromonas piscicida]